MWGGQPVQQTQWKQSDAPQKGCGGKDNGCKGGGKGFGDGGGKGMEGGWGMKGKGDGWGMKGKGDGWGMKGDGWGMKGWGMKGGWGKGDGGWGMKGMDKGKGKGKRRPGGPGLPRARITEQPVTGEVAEWKGKYGWITPTIPVEHEMAQKNKGRLYVSMSDLTGGLTALTAGSLCQFHVFSDASGLGAEEVIGS
eukprot:TRINITY_DN2156_c0_g1_i2.p1 TRINITY_DN2156_c0_g1~~TRINITY_DN2156_c0_g1_i2.p1  ORF type:complete len:194 (+),score=42.23 TRINITY_DN2156_c0_g1_i2:81-662(+)